MTIRKEHINYVHYKSGSQWKRSFFCVSYGIYWLYDYKWHVHSVLETMDIVVFCFIKVSYESGGMTTDCTINDRKSFNSSISLPTDFKNSERKSISDTIGTLFTLWKLFWALSGPSDRTNHSQRESFDKSGIVCFGLSLLSW